MFSCIKLRSIMTCNLREIRIAIGLTQRQVADLFGQTPSNISHYESGKQDLPARCARMLIHAAAANGKAVTFDDVYGVSPTDSTQEAA